MSWQRPRVSLRRRIRASAARTCRRVCGRSTICPISISTCSISSICPVSRWSAFGRRVDRGRDRGEIDGAHREAGHGQCRRRQSRRPRDPRYRRYFRHHRARISRSSYCDPSIGRRDYKTLPDAELLAAARAREATARFAWNPYFHNPRLKSRLHRIRIPTLFLWGHHDRMLSEAYGRAYCAMIPGARFERSSTPDIFRMRNSRSFSPKASWRSPRQMKRSR